MATTTSLPLLLDQPASSRIPASQPPRIPEQAGIAADVQPLDALPLKHRPAPAPVRPRVRATGIEIRNSLPPPVRGWYSRTPPCWRAMVRASCSPSPIPRGLPLSGSPPCSNGAKIRSRSSGATPGPRSRTEIVGGLDRLAVECRSRHADPRLHRRALRARTSTALSRGWPGPGEPRPDRREASGGASLTSMLQGCGFPGQLERLLGQPRRAGTVCQDQRFRVGLQAGPGGTSRRAVAAAPRRTGRSSRPSPRRSSASALVVSQDRGRAEDRGQRRLHLVGQVAEEAVLDLLEAAQIVVGSPELVGPRRDGLLQTIPMACQLRVQPGLLQPDRQMPGDRVEEPHVVAVELPVRLRRVGQEAQAGATRTGTATADLQAVEGRRRLPPAALRPAGRRRRRAGPTRACAAAVPGRPGERAADLPARPQARSQARPADLVAPHQRDHAAPRGSRRRPRAPRR